MRSLAEANRATALLDEVTLAKAFRGELVPQDKADEKEEDSQERGHGKGVITM